MDAVPGIRIIENKTFGKGTLESAEVPGVATVANGDG
jgi:hypothetical protein